MRKLVPSSEAGEEIASFLGLPGLPLPWIIVNAKGRYELGRPGNMASKEILCYSVLTPQDAT